MTNFKQLLASFGVGAARVDARLATATSFPGGVIEGELAIQGGDVAQTIDTVRVAVATDYKREVGDNTLWETFILAQQQLSEQLVVAPQARMSLPFRLQLPYGTPLTVGRQRVYVRSTLAIANALDPHDSDSVQITPHPTMQRVFDALEHMGFWLRKAECEYNKRLSQTLPFVQTFEFQPGPNYGRNVEELELVFAPTQTGLDVLLEIDRRGRGWQGMLEEAYDLNERYVRVHVPHTQYDVRALQQQLEQTINQALSSTTLR